MDAQLTAGVIVVMVCKNSLPHNGARDSFIIYNMAEIMQ